MSDHTDIRQHLETIHSGEREAQGEAFRALLEAAGRPPVAWTYEAWDVLVRALGAKDNRLRSIAAQLLCALAASDPEERILRDFDALLEVTRDRKFVTARHALQALWQAGAAGKKQRQVLLQGLSRRFKECAAEKNTTLIRYDIAVCLRRLYDAVPDDAVRATAVALIETEPDPTYRKKYATVWPPKGDRR